MIAFVMLHFSKLPAKRTGRFVRAAFLDVNAKEGFSKVTPHMRQSANATSQSSQTKKGRQREIAIFEGGAAEVAKPEQAAARTLAVEEVAVLQPSAPPGSGVRGGISRSNT
jgi:hypothetical protein